VDPVIARKTWRTVEPLHGIVYFAPEGDAAFAKVGLDAGRMGYFASRSAPMGAVAADVVIATFFNFNPDVVRRVIPRAWTLASPAAVTHARLAAADAVMRRALGKAVESAEVDEAATLARRAAEAACEHPQGRPLFAGHASLPWPEPSHLVLWHAQTLLREFRGDGHVAALCIEELEGIDALVIHAATGEIPAEVLQQTRGWPDGTWATAIDRMRARGFVEPDEPLRLTEAGQTHRQWVEDRTDALAVRAYEPLGEEGCARLRALVRPLSRAVVDSGFLSPVATVEP